MGGRKLKKPMGANLCSRHHMQMFRNWGLRMVPDALSGRFFGNVPLLFGGVYVIAEVCCCTLNCSKCASGKGAFISLYNVQTFPLEKSQKGLVV